MLMTLEEWRRVKEVFDAAWELEPPARENFLAAACRGDDAVRAEVELLLSALAPPLNNGFLSRNTATNASFQSPNG